MKKAFTLIELLTVMGMIAILLAAMGVSISKARTRARIAKATQEAKEMTNAILAYEQYAPDRTLQSKVTGGWVDCNEGSMSMLLGGETGENGERIPVLYNAALSKGTMYDPWGIPYQLMIEKTGDFASDNSTQFMTAPALPNFFRLTDEERQR